MVVVEQLQHELLEAVRKKEVLELQLKSMEFCIDVLKKELYTRKSIPLL